MAEELSARLSPREGRKFAFTVGAAFAVFAFLSWVRGHSTLWWILGGFALALFLAGLIVPGRLTTVRRTWMRVAVAISRVTTPIFMGLVFFCAITPLGLVKRLVGRNTLIHKSGADGYWTRRDPDAGRESSLEHQF